MILTLLSVVSVLNKNELLSVSLLSEVYEVEEGGLGELVNREITQEDEEVLGGFVQEAGEAPVRLRSVEAYSRVKFEELSLALCHFEHRQQSLAVV